MFCSYQMLRSAKLLQCVIKHNNGCKICFVMSSFFAACFSAQGAGCSMSELSLRPTDTEHTVDPLLHSLKENYSNLVTVLVTFFSSIALPLQFWSAYFHCCENSHLSPTMCISFQQVRRQSVVRCLYQGGIC